jgi:hypothetical protein
MLRSRSCSPFVTNASGPQCTFLYAFFGPFCKICNKAAQIKDFHEVTGSRELLMPDARVPIQNNNESSGPANETYSIKVQELAGSGMNFVFVPKMEQDFGIEGKWSRVLKAVPERVYPRLNMQTVLLSTQKQRLQSQDDVLGYLDTFRLRGDP